MAPLPEAGPVFDRLTLRGHNCPFLGDFLASQRSGAQRRTIVGGTLAGADRHMEKRHVECG